MNAHAIGGKPPRNTGLLFKRLIAFVLPVFVIALAVTAFAVMAAMKPKPEEKEDVVKALPVITAKAVAEDIMLKVTAQGEVQPRQQINIVPQVGGKISYMSPKFIEGGQFDKGDLLIRIESAEYDLRVTQAQANVAQAETVVTREKSESEIALRDWEELGRPGRPSALTLRQPQMAEAAARLEAARAQLEEAQLQQRRTAIYAPFSGRVTERFVDQGEFVNVGTKLGQVYSTAVMDVKLPLTNEDLARADLKLGFIASKDNPGIPVKLTANVAGDYASWTGHIVRTDSRFDPETRVLFAYAEVRDPFGEGASDGIPLAPGIFVTAEIDGEAIEDSVIIPRSALRGKDQVFVAQTDGTLTIKTVQVASSDRNKAVITGGLYAGTSVITSPIRGAAEGMKIEQVERSASAEAEASVSGETQAN